MNSEATTRILSKYFQVNVSDALGGDTEVEVVCGEARGYFAVAAKEFELNSPEKIRDLIGSRFDQTIEELVKRNVEAR